MSFCVLTSCRYHQNPMVDHWNQQHEMNLVGHERRQTPTASASTRLMDPSNSAPSPSKARDDLFRPGCSTAPVHGRFDMKADLPPERPLPFGVKRDKHPISKSTSAQATTKKQKQADSYHHAAVSLSEHKPTSPKRKGEEQLHAEEIDTQLLLAKVEARKSNSSKRQKSSAPPAKQTIKQNSQTATVVRKPRRNIRCLPCRSKRCKCERDPENPDGACVPCVTAGKKCSFVADLDFDSDDAESEQLNVQVPNSQEETSQVSQPLRISLGVRGVPPLKKLDEANIPEPQESKKRPSQIAMPAPKRVERQTEGIDGQVEKPTKNKGMAKDVEAVPAIRELSTALRTPLKPVVNPPDTIRSDATTMTATTLDLDPVTPISNIKLFRNPPKQVTASLQLNRSDLRSGQDNLQTNVPQTLPNAALNKTGLNMCPSTTHDDDAQKTYESFMTSNLSTFLQIDSESQKDTLSSLCSIALYDDDFLAFAKVVEHIWETGIFDGKI